MDLVINGSRHRIQSDPDSPLLTVLRDELDLTGAKYGCGEGQCGACTVLLDGIPVRSCLTPVKAALSKQVATIESLAQDGRLHPLQEAFIEADAMQCGYCTPGMIIELRRPSPQETQSHRRRNQVGLAGQSLPLRYLSTHPCSRAHGCPAIRREGRMNILEPERYELHAGPLYHFAPDRRDFLKIIGGGLAVLLVLNSEADAQERGHALPQDIAAWLHIAESGAITVYTGKVEVGQNIRTSLTQAVAEELHVGPSQITLVMGDTALTPYDMGTFGSRTTPTMAPQLRKVAAAARETLLELAAERWKTDRASIFAENGLVRDKASSHTLSYGELTHGQNLVKTVTPEIHLTPAVDWKIAGHDLHKVNARSIVTGQEKYTSDWKLPGMLYGRVVRPAAFRATLASVDTQSAEQIPGVVAVRDGDFIGVACQDSSQLDRASAAIHAQWKTVPQTNSRELYTWLKEKAETQPAWQPVEADVHAQATYQVAYIAHTPLEPRAAVAQWQNGQLTVWTGTQVPFGVKSESPRPSAFPKKKCASSFLPPVPDTAANIPANAPSKRPVSLKPPDVPSSCNGPAKRK